MKTGLKWLFGMVVIFAVLGLSLTSAQAQKAEAGAAQVTQTVTLSATVTRTPLLLAPETPESEEDILKNAPTPPAGCANPCLSGLVLLVGLMWAARALPGWIRR